MLSRSKISKSLWIESLKTTTYVLNRVPTKVVPKAPIELFKGWKPSLTYICVWGCSSKVRIHNPKESKLDPWTIIGYSIGYTEISKGYKFYCLSNSTRVVESRNAKFLKNNFISRSDQIKNTISYKRSTFHSKSKIDCCI